MFIHLSDARDSLLRNDRTVHDIICVARLRREVSVGQAQAEMNAVQDHIDELNPSTERGLGTYIAPLKQFFIGDVGGTLLLLLGAVGFVLLIACANVANLLLARSAARTREFAVRLALGASRVQIVRQLVTESVLLSLIGGVLGLAIAKWGIHAVLAAAPGSCPAHREHRRECFGPLIHVWCFDDGWNCVWPLARAEEFEDRRASGAQGRRPWFSGRPSTHSTCSRSCANRAGSGPADGRQLALSHDSQLVGGESRFRIHGTSSLSRSDFRRRRSTTPSKVRIAYQQLVDRIRQIPGVEAADITALVPLSQRDNSGPFWVGSRQPASMAEIPRAIVLSDWS